ncbi:unnamed protein product [Victoria cruziana]
MGRMCYKRTDNSEITESTHGRLEEVLGPHSTGCHVHGAERGAGGQLGVPVLAGGGGPDALFLLRHSGRGFVDLRELDLLAGEEILQKLPRGWPMRRRRCWFPPPFGARVVERRSAGGWGKGEGGDEDEGEREEKPQWRRGASHTQSQRKRSGIGQLG